MTTRKFKVLFISMLSCFFISTTPISASDNPFVDNLSNAENMSSGITSSGFVYSPFESSIQSETSEEGVVYGPGGDPIGGLPVESGSLLLFSGVLAFALFKLIKVRQTIKSN